MEYPHRNDLFRDITGFQARIIDELPFLPEEKADLKKTYHRLSSLVHPAPEQMKRMIENPDLSFTFFYNEDFFNESIGFVDEVMDLTFAITLHRFPCLKEMIKSDENGLLYDSLGRLPITNRILNEITGH